jgi:predicted alpha/beta-fold hydrolase
MMETVFPEKNFKSVPWCFNGHFHTVLCSIVMSAPDLDSERVEIDTPDDDFLELDVLGRDSKRPVAVLFHGLEGHSKRYYIARLAKEISDRNFNVVLVNFRGCGDKINRKKRFYHSGEIEDVETILSWVRQQYPNVPLFTAGFSLGSSVLLNYLKAHGTHHPISGNVGISTPFELKKGCENLDKGLNKLYSKRFLVMLEDKLERKRDAHPDLPIYTGKSLYDFDNQVTAPIHGFLDADDYYQKCSSYYFMDQIKTESLIIHSKADPMTPFKWAPIREIRDNSKLFSCFPNEGGHVGFWSKPQGWLEKTVADFFESFKSNGKAPSNVTV